MFIPSEMRTTFFVALSGIAVIASVVAPSAQAASPYQLTGGTTSVTLNNASLAGLGLNFSGTSGTVSPAAGFNYGFGILPPSSNPSFVGSSFIFNYDGGTFTPVSGSIEHTGSLQYSVDPSLALLSPFEIGDFSIGSNGSGFSLTDNFTTGTPLFVLVINPANAVLTGGSLTVTGIIILVSDQFNDILENATGNYDLNLTGTVLGTAQINATAQAVPTPALLPGLLGFLGAMLTQRRRQST